MSQEKVKIYILLNMSVINPLLCESVTNELDWLAVPLTQTSVEEGDG